MNTTIELTPEQTELLLTGLRYVRSAVALDVQDWSEEIEAERDRRYEVLDGLEESLNRTAKTAKTETARV